MAAWLCDCVIRIGVRLIVLREVSGSGLGLALWMVGWQRFLYDSETCYPGLFALSRLLCPQDRNDSHWRINERLS